MQIPDMQSTLYRSPGSVFDCGRFVYDPIGNRFASSNPIERGSKARNNNVCCLLRLFIIPNIRGADTNRKHRDVF